jgi:hypothetical protein
MSTIENNIWQAFAPVVPFWAAYQLMLVPSARPGNRSVFPCRAEDLTYFLSVSENLRRVGESCRLKNREKPLLDPGKTWSVSSETELSLEGCLATEAADTAYSDDRRYLPDNRPGSDEDLQSDRRGEAEGYSCWAPSVGVYTSIEALLHGGVA